MRAGAGNRLLPVLASCVAVMVISSCDNPFMPKLSKSTELFELSHDFMGGPRIIAQTPVTLRWTEVTIPEFKKLTLYRTSLGGLKEVWRTRAEIADPLTVTYTDTLDDDRTFQYKIRIEDREGNFREAKSAPIVLLTTRIVVPDEFQSLQTAYDSPFMDSGDTLWVQPGTYDRAYRFAGKDVLIQSVGGKELTVLKRGGTVVSMSRGHLKGFTIMAGMVELSGTAVMSDCLVTGVFTFDMAFSGVPRQLRSAVVASDTATVINCVISNNRKYSITRLGVGGSPADGGGMIVKDRATVRNSRISENVAGERGGGISVSGSPTIENTIIDNNYALGWMGGGGLFINEGASPTILNSVIYGNGSRTKRYGAILGGGPDLKIMNTIVWANSRSSSAAENKVWTSATYSDIQGFEEGTGNIARPPRFVDAPNGDFHLRDDSPCIDAGNPDPVYNDTDGSRNDIGAYGGPHGDW